MSDAPAVLRNAGLRATPKRAAIFGALASAATPRTAESLYASLPKPKANLATVYRTLESFEKAGLVRRVDLRHGHAHFELAGDEHHHLVCTSCSKIEDFKDCDVAPLTKRVLKGSKKFNTITSHSLEFFGLCNSCIKT